MTLYKKARLLIGAALLTCGLQVPAAMAQNSPNAKTSPNARTQAVIDYWTADRMKSAIPRDLRRDEQGLGYIRGEKGAWVPYGHDKEWRGPPQEERKGPPHRFVAPTNYPIIDGDTIALDEWSRGGDVQTAVGRIYFEVPERPNLRKWIPAVCSGTVVTDQTTGRSNILTAAHCIYDTAYSAFARNVLFIPNQAQTSSGGTDLNCTNDPVGCWVPSFGVVATGWASSDPYDWDFGFYVVPDQGAHVGANSSSDALDEAVRVLSISFSAPSIEDGQTGAGSADYSYALGYPLNLDPNFMHCAEDTTRIYTQMFLPSCWMRGGSSGGPWIQPMDVGTGSGPIISVNSYGPTTAAGMAGPLLNRGAACVFEAAKTTRFEAVMTQDAQQGIKVGGC